MPFVDAVGGGEEQQIADDQRGACRHIVREHIEVLDHVKFPNDVGVGLVLVLRVLSADVAAGEPVDAGADDGAAVRAIVNAIAVDDRRRAQSLTRPIMDLTGRELVVNCLPEECPCFFVEAHQNALVDGRSHRLIGGGFAAIAFIARVFVVGAAEDLAAGDRRPP